MAKVNDDRPLKEYNVPWNEEPHSSIVNPVIVNKNFELDPPLLSMVEYNQFCGSPTDDPNLHLSIFIKFCDTLKCKGVNPIATRFILSPFSLRDRSKE